MTWKHLGTAGFGRLIEANDDLAAYLAARCVEADDLEALPERPGAVGRLLPPRAGGSGWRRGGVDAHQDRLQAALEVSGDGWLTTTRLRGATWLRAGIVNYLSTEADIDRLLDTLRRLADVATTGCTWTSERRLLLRQRRRPVDPRCDPLDGRRTASPPPSRAARRGRGTRARRWPGAGARTGSRR